LESHKDVNLYINLQIIIDNDLKANQSFASVGPGSYDAPLIHRKNEPKWS